jgi:hypothetical protein
VSQNKSILHKVVVPSDFVTAKKGD